MLRILGRNRTLAKSVKMATRFESQNDTYVVLEDLSSWELVNSTDGEQNDHDFKNLLKQENPCETDHFDDKKLFNQETPCLFESPLAQITGPLLDEYFEADNDDDEEEDDDLDDELVPKWLSDKFGRQRIRKLGKRVCSRMNKCKKVPYYYNRPGCVTGKHGLGVQHSYI